MRFCPECARLLVMKLTFEGRVRPTCEACGFIHFADPKLAVAVVVAEQGKILLNRRTIEPGRGKWSLPGGFVDRGEVVEAAARREVKEETNFDVQIDRLLGLYSEPGNPVVLAVYEATRLDGEFRPNGEVSEIAFFPPDALPDLAFPQNQQIVGDWCHQRDRGKDQSCAS